MSQELTWTVAVTAVVVQREGEGLGKENESLLVQLTVYQQVRRKIKEKQRAVVWA